MILIMFTVQNCNLAHTFHLIISINTSVLMENINMLEIIF